jgi:hypothetical protein
MIDMLLPLAAVSLGLQALGIVFAFTRLRASSADKGRWRTRLPPQLVNQTLSAGRCPSENVDFPAISSGAGPVGTPKQKKP